PGGDERSVSTGDPDGVTAQRVPWTRRWRGRREEHEKSGRSQRGEDERCLRQPLRANRICSELRLPCLGQQLSECVALREDAPEFYFRAPEEGRVLTRAKARIATAGMVLQQRLFAEVFELLEFRQDDFVAVPVDGEHLNEPRTMTYAQSPASPSRKI